MRHDRERERESTAAAAPQRAAAFFPFLFFHLHAHINASISHACDVSDTGSITWPVTTPSLPLPHPEGLPDAAWLPQWTTTWSRHSRLWFVQQQVTATAMFAWRRSVFLQYLLDFRLRLDLASTQRQIEHLPRNATWVDQIYPFIYSFMLSLYQEQPAQF